MRLKDALTYACTGMLTRYVRGVESIHETNCRNEEKSEHGIEQRKQTHVSPTSIITITKLDDFVDIIETKIRLLRIR